jgi:RNA polymerase-interacting CarD/CdnL/TRCF family regulator
MTVFQEGDTVVHPDYGAGIVTEIRALKFLGNEEKRYYSIKLLGEPKTVVMVPVKNEAKVGLRPPVRPSRLSRIWRVLRSDPNKLPSNYKKRQQMLQERLHNASAVEVARVLRDLAWREERKRGLTVRGKRLYRKGMKFLAGEVAGAQGTEYSAAKSQILDVLHASMATSTVG